MSLVNLVNNPMIESNAFYVYKTADVCLLAVEI